LSQHLTIETNSILRPGLQNTISIDHAGQDRTMRLEPVSTSRRSILKFAGAMPAVLTLGGMATCTPQANHGPDRPHVADAKGEELWQAMDLAARTQSYQQQFPSALEALENQEITLIGFI
jgi:hypothetical protein